MQCIEKPPPHELTAKQVAMRIRVGLLAGAVLGFLAMPVIPVIAGIAHSLMTGWFPETEWRVVLIFTSLICIILDIVFVAMCLTNFFESLKDGFVYKVREFFDMER